MVASPLPAFLLDVTTGPGIEVSREGAATRIDIVTEALSTGGAGNVFRVDTGDRLKSLRGGIGLLIQADRTNTGPATLVVDGFERPLLDAGGNPQIANRIVEGRFYQVLFDAGAEAWRVQAGASTLDEIPGLNEARAAAETAAETAIEKAAQAQADADAISGAVLSVEAARVEVAAIAPAVQADRAEVAQARTVVETARVASEVARDVAVANSAAGQLTFPTMTALTAYTPPDQTKTYYADVVGQPFRYIWAGASPWTVTTVPTLLGLNGRTTVLEDNQPLALPYMGVTVPDLAWGVADDPGKLAIGVDAAGEPVGIIGQRIVQTEKAAPIETPYLGGEDADGPGDVVWGVGDEAGKLGLGLTRGSRLTGGAVDALRAERVLPDPEGLGPVAYTKQFNGRETIYVIGGSGETRVTDGTFDARSPVVVGGGQGVKYASDRDGTMRLWRAPFTGGVHIKALSDTLEHNADYGQSNGTRFGLAGSTSGRLTQTFPAPNQALMFVGGLFPHFANGSQNSPADPIPDANLASLVSLSNLYSGTASSLEATGYGYSELLAAALPRALLFSNHSVPGFSYAQLKRGTVPYANMLKSISAGKRLAASVGMRHVLANFRFFHGEADSQNPLYLQFLTDLQAATNKDVSAITGQTVPIRFWLTQIANWTSPGAGNFPTSVAALAQLAAHETLPGMRLVMPTYHLEHNAGPAPGDKIHIPAYGIRWKDEKFAQAVLVGPSWECLRPVSVVASGTTVTVSFAGRTGPLRFNIYDQATNPNGVSDPGNRGFEFTDGSGGSATIASVALSGDATQVVITLSAAPSPGAMLGYAYTGTPGAAGGPLTGPRGCLCDSDPQAPSAVLQQHRITALAQTAQQAADPLTNWCVAFRKPITIN